MKTRKMYTLTTIVFLFFVSTVAAIVELGRIEGGNVNVYVPYSGSMDYCSDKSAWLSTLIITTNTNWYSRISVSTGDYPSDVLVMWFLEVNVDGWSKVSGSDFNTTVTISTPQIVYATHNGSLNGNRKNWGDNSTSSGVYRVVAVIVP